MPLGKAAVAARDNSHLFAIGRRASNTASFSVIRVYDADGNVIETHERKGDFKGCERYRVKQKPPCSEARRLIASVG
jgi:hypothetical protein